MRKKIDILMLVEVNVKLASIKNVMTIAATQPSVAIYVLNPNIKVKPIITHENFIMVKLLDYNIHLIAYYLRPYADYKQKEEYDLLCKQITTFKQEAIAMGDLNAHHAALGDLSDERGEHMYALIESAGWTIINDPNQTTYTHVQGLTSTNDWTFATPSIASLTEWSIDDEFDHYSDHRMCLCKVKTNVSTEYKSIVIKPAKFLKKIKEITSIDRLNEWHENITTAANYATEERSFTHHENFFDKKLRASKKRILEVNKRLKALKYAGNLSEIQRVKELIKELNKQHQADVKKARQDHYIKFLRETDDQNAFKRLLNPIKSRNRNNIDHLQHDGERIVDAAIIAKTILNSYAPVQQPQQENNMHLQSTAENQPTLTNLEIREVIFSFKPRKAPGIDRISSELIQEWYKIDPEYLNSLFKMWFDNEIFPTEFKTCLIVPIIKDGTKQTTVGNIRCLGMLNHLGKMYEKLICRRIMYSTTICKYLSTEQYAYLPGCSAEQAIRKLQDAREKNAAAAPVRHELMASLDIKAAFDSINHSAVLNSLIQANCPSNIFTILKDYFVDRKAKVLICDESYEKIMTKGIVQGSSLSAFLWAISMETIIKKIKQEASKIKDISFTLVVYADDINWVIASQKGFATCLQTMNRLFNATNLALTDVGLNLSIPKTQIMLTHKGQVNCKIKLNEEIIQLKNEIKILGVIFHKDSNFIDHVKRVTVKAKQKFIAFAGAFRIKDALDRRVKEKLIQSIIYPTVAYASDTWFNMRDEKICSQIKVLSRAMQIKSANAFKTVSHIAAMFLSKILPLQYWIKRKVDTVNALKKKKWNQNIIDKAVIASDLQPTYMHRKIEYKKIMYTYQVNDLIEETRIFTDGSKTISESSAKVGCAIAINKKQSNEWLVKKFKLNEEATNNQAELMALDEAIKWAEQNITSPVAILSDSQAMLNAITSISPNFQSSKKTQENLTRALLRNPNINLYWVKAHAGIEGNEKADEAAKQASDDGIAVTSYVSQSYIRKMINKSITSKINNEIQQSPWGRTIKIFFNAIDDPMRRHATINSYTTRIYTGHLPSRQYLHERKKITSPLCSCNKVHNVQHILTDCHEHVQANIAAANKAKLALADLFGDWQQLRTNKLLHKYILLRAKSLITELIDASNSYATVQATQDQQAQANESENQSVCIDIDEDYERLMETIASERVKTVNANRKRRVYDDENNQVSPKRRADLENDPNEEPVHVGNDAQDQSSSHQIFLQEHDQFAHHESNSSNQQEQGPQFQLEHHQGLADVTIRICESSLVENTSRENEKRSVASSDDEQNSPKRVRLF